MNTPEQRDCTACKFRRIPYARKVSKNKKTWIVFECPLCHQHDIEPYKPRKVYNDKTRKWEDEIIPNEDFED